MKKLLFILICSVPLYAQNVNLNINKIFFGKQVSGITARSLAMGGAGLAGGNAFLAASHNPALAINSTGSLAFNAGFALNNLEEDRSVPYRDNFDGFVDFGSYYFQNNWYAIGHGQLVYTPDFDGLMNLHIATGYVPFMDFNYDYFEEVRDPGFGDALLAYNIIEAEGRLSAIPVNVAVQPFDFLSVGAGVSLLTGSFDYLEKIESKNQKAEAGAYRLTYDTSLDDMPVVPSLGAVYNYDERLRFGVSYRLPFTLNTTSKIRRTPVDTTIQQSRKRSMDYPARLGLGFDYRFENILAAQIMIDYYYEFWSDFEDSWNKALQFEDTYTFHVGVEHLFFDGVPLRAGLKYGTLREDKNMTETVLSAGTGFEFKDVFFDFSVGYANTQYYQKDIFDNAAYGLDSRTDLDRVNWTEFFARIDLSYTFK